MFIKLTNSDDVKIRTNIDHIINYFHLEGLNCIVLNGNINPIKVKETPEQIDELIEKAMNRREYNCNLKAEVREY